MLKMKATVRIYHHDNDFARISQFLLKTYKANSAYINWLQPRWEYMHYHPLIWEVDRSTIGVWEIEGEVVGVVHPEHFMGTAYFEIHPDHNRLKKEMLTFAEEHIAILKNGKNSLTIFINDHDEDFQSIAADMGYANTDETMPTTQFVISEPFPGIELRNGFRLMSLADDNDLVKVNRLLYRGFNHGDEPPDDGIKERKFMQSAPNYRKDLNIVVQAPDGSLASYCGMWYEPENKIAMVEPVCTDPDYRRMGLASKVVIEGIRRCGVYGAKVAYVGSDAPLYLSLGFRQICNFTLWQREWI